MIRGCAAFNGGVSHGGPSTLTIEDSSIVDDRTTGNSSAGIAITGATALLRNTTVALNTISDPLGGGAGLAQSGGKTTIVSSTFAANTPRT